VRAGGSEVGSVAAPAFVEVDGVLARRQAGDFETHYQALVAGLAADGADLFAGGVDDGTLEALGEDGGDAVVPTARFGRRPARGERNRERGDAALDQRTSATGWITAQAMRAPLLPLGSVE
jgi:hypothetical protein